MADSATLQPVPGAWVNTTPSGTAVQTHSNGGFLVYRQAGTYTVSCHLEGYEVPATRTETLVPGDSLLVDFVLVPAQQQQSAA